MARQKGIIKVKGTMGDMSFYKTKDGHLVREKGGIDANRIKNDPAFQRTRENGQEFGTAGKAGQVIRKGVRILMRRAKDNRVTSRLTQKLMQVVKSDSINERGSRTVQDGNMQLLTDFDFNIRGKLSTVFFNGYTPVFDRPNGTFDLQIDEFIPQETIEAPQGTTHIQIVGGICATDFEGRSFEEGHDESAIIPWDMQTQPPLTLSASISAASTQPVLQLVGVNFFQEVNGDMYPLKNGSFNALAVASVDQL